jgi:preprotein translocase subunit SecG
MSSGGCYTQKVMSWLIIAVTAVHVIVCLILILVVLLQSGKAADLAGAFGGMGSQTVFGPRGTATVLSKATTVAAALFMITSLSLGILSNGQARSSGSVLENRTKKAPVQQKSKTTTTQLPIPSTPAPAATPIPDSTKK